MRAGYPPEDELEAADLAAARWCWQNNRPAGRGADTLPGGRLLFLPLRTGSGPVGVMGIESDGAAGDPARCSPPTSAACSTRSATRPRSSIERITLAEDVDRARLLAETERLRSALLTSISHDLRTPLASILGAASSLESYDALLDARGRARPVAHHPGGGRAARPLRRQPAGHDPAGSRRAGAEAGGRRPRRAGRQRAARAGKVLAGHRVEVDIAPDLPLPELDVVLFEQALFNVLDNAAKYAPEGSTVKLRG